MEDNKVHCDPPRMLTLTETYPYITNMLKFTKKYNLDIKDCYKSKTSKPRFCLYNNNKSLYMTKDILDDIAETKEEKKELIDYIKETFDKPMDYGVIPEEEYSNNSDEKNTYMLLSQEF